MIHGLAIAIVETTFRPILQWRQLAQNIYIYFFQIIIFDCVNS